VEIGIILLLVLMNGAFSMAELAVVSARKVRLRQRAEEGDTASAAALDLAENPNRFLSTVQVGITLIGTLTGAFGGASMAGDLAEVLRRWPALAPYAGQLALFLIVLAVSYLSLVLGELVPKRLALSNPELIAARVAGPMRMFASLGRPLVWLLSVSTDAVARLLGIQKPNDSPVTPEEITVLMEQGEQVGVFEEAETDIVEALFRLGDLRAGALMTPRTEIDWIDPDDPLEVSLREVIESPHLHFPVGRGSLDSVTGIVRGKDVLALARTMPEDPEATGVIDISHLIQPARFIPESLPAFQTLAVLKEAAGNLALVIDEYGGVLGLVTLFDVMEAMVGGISAAGEPVEPDAVQRDDGSWLVEGMMRIDTFKDLLDIEELPNEERAGYQTLGGFVMAQMGEVPKPGQNFTCCGWRYEVVDMDGMRVDKVMVSPAVEMV
jgi:putative hemolysin